MTGPPVITKAGSATENHGQNFLVKRKNNSKSYKIKNNGENVVEFYNNV